MTGFAAMTAPAFAQFNTVAKMPNLYKVEVLKTASDDDVPEVAGLTADLLPAMDERTSETTVYDDAYKKELDSPLPQRLLSVAAYPYQFDFRLPHRPVHRQEEIPQRG